MDRAVFFGLLRQDVFPMLRREGFGGSGNSLRRMSGPLVHVVNFQASSSGGHCYLNLGVHLSFLPTPGGKDAAPDQLDEASCAFRFRIDSPDPSGGWVYGESANQAKESVTGLASGWSHVGKAFFESYAKYPDSFVSILDGLDPSEMRSVDLLSHARIAMHLGRVEQANRLVEAGLRKCPPVASSLRANLRRVVPPCP
ncbi:DUF4304 domain-containing protein [Stenotrophomonas rhizophila]|uniref:DUF4304 domain-containing protein n=1 Tax=Stenotrophomonas rhizophila TaxID=216778 RepID=UPI0010C0080A|nr:DUF4304 domain-containing protein [Stenotrophomonas rhizophila]TKK10071.1 DUF4304 domain-containing protein [Stenotrophomonas rhizophila]